MEHELEVESDTGLRARHITMLPLPESFTQQYQQQHASHIQAEIPAVVSEYTYGSHQNSYSTPQSGIGTYPRVGQKQAAMSLVQRYADVSSHTYSKQNEYTPDLPEPAWYIRAKHMVYNTYKVPVSRRLSQWVAYWKLSSTVRGRYISPAEYFILFILIVLLLLSPVLWYTSSWLLHPVYQSYRHTSPIARVGQRVLETRGYQPTCDLLTNYLDQRPQESCVAGWEIGIPQHILAVRTPGTGVQIMINPSFYVSNMTDAQLPVLTQRSITTQFTLQSCPSGVLPEPITVQKILWFHVIGIFYSPEQKQQVEKSFTDQAAYCIQAYLELYLGNSVCPGATQV